MPVIPIPRPLAIAGGVEGGGPELGDLLGAAAAATSWVVDQFRRAPRGAGVGLVQEEVQTLEEMIQDAYDGARLAVGSPMPPPLPDPGPLAGMVWGGLVNLAQGLATWWIPPGVTDADWALLNSRPEVFTVLPPNVGAWPTGSIDRSGPNRWTVLTSGQPIDCNRPGATGEPTGPPEQWEGTVDTEAGQFAWVTPWTPYNPYDVEAVLSGFIKVGPGIGEGTAVAAFYCCSFWAPGASLSISVAPLTPGVSGEPLPVLSGDMPSGWAPPGTFPKIPAPAPATTPPPQPRPIAVPALPAAPPMIEPAPSAPAPATVPAARPAILPLPAPAPATGVTITRGGTLPAPTTTAPATTAVGTKVITRGGSQVQVVPVAVPATLAGIAQELGRVERKLALQLDRPDPPAFDPEGLLEDLQKLLEDLFGQQGAKDPEGAYLLSSPCERDESGNPLPPTAVGFPESSVGLPAVLKRLDALAALLQVHKTLKQPSCKHPRPQGDLVTVTFEQV